MLIGIRQTKAACCEEFEQNITSKLIVFDCYVLIVKNVLISISMCDFNFLF